MSKVEELRLEFPKVRKSTFEKFVEGDKTKTKKYLKFMLKSWTYPYRQYIIGDSDNLIKLVNMFDELLPYIKNKDIYSPEYADISHFVSIIDEAIEIKNEKTFVREEHVDVLYECNDYILLQPKTHRGSLKYGANTKWCTSSVRDESTFERYHSNGFLVYLISKNESKPENLRKIAFYTSKNQDPFFDSMEVYNTLDKRIYFDNIIKDGGWDALEMFKIISTYKANFVNWKVLTHSKENIRKALLTLSNIDFDSLKQSLKIVENFNDVYYINDVKNRLNNFIKSIPVNL